jgi:hypothetical protein
MEVEVVAVEEGVSSQVTEAKLAPATKEYDTHEKGYTSCTDKFC